MKSRPSASSSKSWRVLATSERTHHGRHLCHSRRVPEGHDDPSMKQPQGSCRKHPLNWLSSGPRKREPFLGAQSRQERPQPEGDGKARAIAKAPKLGAAARVLTLSVCGLSDESFLYALCGSEECSGWARGVPAYGFTA